jgi:hypothetical protein
MVRIEPPQTAILPCLKCKKKTLHALRLIWINHRYATYYCEDGEKEKCGEAIAVTPETLRRYLDEETTQARKI